MFKIEKCDLCGDCLVRCPYIEYSRERAVEEFKELIDGGAPSILDLCVTCFACNQFCEKGARPFDLILKRQEESGVPKIPETNIELFRNLPLAPSEIIMGEPSRPVISLCSVGDLIPGLFEGEIFKGATLLKGGDYFCGIGWLHLGKEEPLREIAPRVISNLASQGAEEIVFYHDDCYTLISSIAKEYGIEVPFRAKHIIEYLLELARGQADKISPLGIRIAYQQPCASRYTPWKDSWLDELFELLGVERVNRKYDRISALCCGSPVVPRDRERAMEIRRTNVDDALSHGAQAIVYLCPLCYLSLKKVAASAGLGNFHIIQLVEKAFTGS